MRKEADALCDYRALQEKTIRKGLGLIGPETEYKERLDLLAEF
jgi:hypothetical protein